MHVKQQAKDSICFQSFHQSELNSELECSGLTIIRKYTEIFSLTLLRSISRGRSNAKTSKCPLPHLIKIILTSFLIGWGEVSREKEGQTRFYYDEVCFLKVTFATGSSCSNLGFPSQILQPQGVASVRALSSHPSSEMKLGLLTCRAVLSPPSPHILNIILLNQYFYKSYMEQDILRRTNAQ